MAAFNMPGLMISKTATEKNRDRWAKLGREWEDFDRVYMTEEQAVGLADKTAASTYLNSDYLLNPSIPEFTAIMREEGRKETTYICFRRTLMRKEDFWFEEAEGVTRAAEPTVDAYFYINNGGKICNFVATFCKVTIESKGSSMTCTAQVLTYCHDDPYSEWVVTNDRVFFHEFLRSAKCLYLGVQMLSLERPEIMAAETVRENRRMTVKKKGRYKAVNKVSLVKIIRISDTALNDAAGGHHSMTCPCWGVAGHWRTCRTEIQKSYLTRRIFFPLWANAWERTREGGLARSSLKREKRGNTLTVLKKTWNASVKNSAA